MTMIIYIDSQIRHLFELLITVIQDMHIQQIFNLDFFDERQIFVLKISIFDRS